MCFQLERILDPEVLEHRARHGERVVERRGLRLGTCDRRHDDPFGTERSRDADRHVGRQPAVDQRTTVDHDRTHEQRQRHAGSQRAREVAPAERDDRPIVEVGRDRPEGNRQCIEVAARHEVRAENEARETGAHFALAHRAGLQHPLGRFALPRDHRLEHTERGGDLRCIVANEHVEFRRPHPRLDLATARPRRIHRTEDRTHARADDEIGTDAE